MNIIMTAIDCAPAVVGLAMMAYAVRASNAADGAYPAHDDAHTAFDTYQAATHRADTIGLTGAAIGCAWYIGALFAMMTVGGAL